MKKRPDRTRLDRVLVTGSTGFIGANLVRRLVDEGYEVYILTRKTSKKWRLSDIFPKLNDYVVDLLEYGKLEGIIKEIEPDIIFHLATAGIYSGWHLPERQLIETNFIGTFNLINACSEVDYKCFVNTGSSSEYGPKDNSMKEADICEPTNTYGVTKLASTLYGRLIAKAKGKPITTLRIFSPFGPYDDSSRLITYVVTNALQNRELNLANPNSVRDYIYIDDVLDLYVRCIDKAHKYKGEIFNVGSGSEMAISYVVNKIIEFTGSRSSVKWNVVAGQPFDTNKWEADIRKASHCFNWHPKHSTEQGLRKTVSWFKNNLSLYTDKK